MRSLFKFCTSTIRIFMRVLWRYEVINSEKLTHSKSVIIAANHISWYDPPFIGSVLPFEISILAKAELFKNKFIGRILHKLNAIPIVRETNDIKGIYTVFKSIQSGRSLLLFPQGTRNGKSIKPGVGLFAMRMRKDILPVYIENSDKLWSCFFSPKKKIIIKIGDLIKQEYYSDWEVNTDNYQKLAEYTYTKIMELKDEYRAS